jgi:ACS family glucarate transporter-like MFS transporter
MRAAKATQSEAKQMSSSSKPGQRPILGFLFVLSIVTYLDRVNISIASPAIEREFMFDHVHLGTIFSAFVVGYMFFQIPAGWLGDRIGHKKCLTWIIIWWSLFTGLMGWVGKGHITSFVGVLGTLWIMRFLVGVGEAGAYPCGNGIIGDWFSIQQRARAVGVMFAGIGIGSAISPPFVAWIVLHWGWRYAFKISAGIGIVLATAVHLWMPERSRQWSEETQLQPDFGQTKNANSPKLPTGRRANQKTPWKKILGSTQVWMLMISIFFFSYVTYVYYFWFYPYLVDIRKISLLRSSFFTAVPFLVMALSAPLGGWLSDRLVPRIGKTLARRWVAIGGLVSAALLIPCGALIPNDYLAVACLSLGAGSLYLAISSYFATALDVFPDNAATVSGTMNTGASLSGVIAPVLTPWIAAHFGWVPALSLAGVFALFAAILWIFIEPDVNQP